MSYQDGLKTAVLNSTNYHRSQHQASNLTWDSTLADYAQDYSKNCKWEHSVFGTKPRSGGQYGENLAQGYLSPTIAVDAWAGEEADYNYNKPQFQESTGHFTQLVWQNTTSVGCGASYCRSTGDESVSGWFLVCEYNPPGNVKGNFRQQVSKPGEDEEGDPGLGAAASDRKGLRRVLGGLATAYVLLAVCV
ncbi:hypothetical protein KC363_g1092 [Hortaea werneckii]|nr:hypothetical protein KC361_g2312 [Hortaea werneckii]KAI6887684.1 hypothetical protein KC325_g1954 [Hortaea werneckii]KAI6998323.1 hypothetical protein KC359_g2435 [Hortaea werneckii]KAI7149104.1 hypothetical protein KC344_g1308 [Hortaea werneckii]KAI7176379.1 hypothetical protein KC360_g3069 [Hortaea werneckii]